MSSTAENNQWKYMEEMCILVDENDHQVGADTKKNCHLIDKKDGSLMRHRAFSVFLFNSESKLLLQKRSDEKITFPGYWANTCCSHPLNVPGETETENDLGVKRAAIRKLKHELGIESDQLSVDDFTGMLTVHYNAASDDTWGENEIDHVLVIKKNVEFKVNPEEVAEARFFTKEEVEHLLDEGDAGREKVSPWFSRISRYYLNTLFEGSEDPKRIVKDGIVAL
ncbi:hypothetical protein WA577_001532 [Blastocystis sp. JDR]